MGELNLFLVGFGVVCLLAGAYMVKNLRPPREDAPAFVRSEAMASIVVFAVLGTFGLGFSLIAYGFGMGHKF